MNISFRSLAIPFVVYLLLQHHDEARADGSSKRKNALLVLRPLISTTEHAPADLIYASVLAGLHDSLQQQRAAEGPDPRRFEKVFTEQSMMGEQAQHIAPIVLFASYTSKELNAVLERRSNQPRQFQLAMLLDMTIAELSPANFEIELRLYNTQWTQESYKRIGGCNETIDELAASVREIAARLNSSEPPSPLPAARIDLAPPTDARTFIVGDRITLDSCGVRDPSGEKLEVTWSSDALPAQSHRRRISLLLDRPQKFTVSQTIDGGLPATTTITVIAPPRADPTVEMLQPDSKPCVMPRPDAAEFGKPFAPIELQNNHGQAGVESVVNPYAIQMAGLRVARGHARESSKSISSAGGQAPSPGSRDIQVIRLNTGDNNICLMANDIQHDQRVQWHQLSGTHINLDPAEPAHKFNLSTAQSGYYVFKLVVTAGDKTDEALLSFLAVPRIHADTRHRIMLAKVGEPLLLDGTGSSDVLGDQISYTWVVSLPSSSHSAFVSFTNPTDEDAIDRGAHIIDSHSAQSRFIADCPGLYHVMLYMRVTRNIDDVSIVDVDASEITVKAVDSNHQMFLDTYMSSTTRAIGHLGYVYEPTISWTSTTARRVTLRGLYGVSAGLGSDKSGWRNGWMIEGMLGMSLRAYDAIQLDLMARVYSRQNQTEDHELRVGSGANISLRLWHNSDLWLWHNSDLWLQLKFQVGFTPLFNYEAQGRFEVVPGMGLAYEH